ncbi:Hypothetical protein SRAE_2000046400 [Strongyloides ratti]|uniref:Mediator complex subunit 15 n=1 Tax=Strongyloides ratti TaxID=34506 RepID=A0A090LCF4_STRRB|nr:Hypothetical protein SRAE_2000046400 [Strongyloides ratti]CEF65788.1 Hypothetical protein SRAE_2000046400 [Strongyloides ratti]
MYLSNTQRSISPQIKKQEINYGQNYTPKNIQERNYSSNQQVNQQYYYYQYPKQQYSSPQFNSSPIYTTHHTPQTQNISHCNNYQSSANIYQEQTPVYQNLVVRRHLTMKNDQQYQNTNYHRTNSLQMSRESRCSGSQIIQHNRIRNSPYSRPPEVKVVQTNLQQYHGQQNVNQRNGYVSENIYKNIPIRQVNSQNLTPSSTEIQCSNVRKPIIQERTLHLDKLKQQQYLVGERKNICNNSVEFQQISTNTAINNALNNSEINTKTIFNRSGVSKENLVSQQVTNKLSKNVELIQPDPIIQYEEAIKKLKKNKEKIKTLLERQQIDGKITDAKERIERLERILNSQEKVSLNFINKFVNATDTKIKDENLCKSVIDVFDNIVKAGDKYKSFQIPHYDPFHEFKEKFLRLPDFEKCNSLEEIDNIISYNLKNNEENEIKIVYEKFNSEEKNKNILDDNKRYFQDDIIQEIDKTTQIITGKDETITKDLKLCGRFKIDPQNIPISDHCREINVIITFDKNNIPPLYLLIPVDYPKSVCSIVNPNCTNEIRDLSLNRLISRVEQALPCLSVYRRIQNIAITWMNLAMNVY